MYEEIRDMNIYIYINNQSYIGVRERFEPIIVLAFCRVLSNALLTPKSPTTKNPRKVR